MDIEKKVKDIIAEQLGVKLEEVRPEAKLIDDLDTDDYDSIQIVMALEEAFDTEIPDDDMEKLLTVKEVIDYIKKKTEDRPKE